MKTAPGSAPRSVVEGTAGRGSVQVGSRIMARRAWSSPRQRKAFARGCRALATYALLLGGGVTIIIPFAWLVSTSLKPASEVFTFPIRWIPRPILWSNYVQVFQTSPFARYLANTAILTSLGVLGSLTGSSIAAYGFARLRFPGRGLLFGIMVGTLMVPPWVVIIPTYLLFDKIGWLNTYLPLLIPAFFATPFNTFLMRQFFMTIPVELEEAARIEGAGRWTVYSRIILPLGRPALIMVSIFGFFYYWNEFLLPLIYLSSQNLFPVSVGVANYVGQLSQNYPLMMAAAAISLAPPLLFFFIFQRFFVQGVVISGVKG